MTKGIDILLVFPQLGSHDGVLRDIPLSLIYAATHSVKNGYRVRILDCRLHRHDWRERIDEMVKDGCHLVGVSVMTGNPIRTGLEVSQYVRSKHNLPVVWGGPHPTSEPEGTIVNPNIDYIIRDWGSKPLWQLIAFLKDGIGSINDIEGLGYKDADGKPVLNPPTTAFEVLEFEDIPYHLAEFDAENYNRLGGSELIFPIYTSVGCPYQCTFCMSPTAYEKVKGKKWMAYSVDDVINHVEELHGRYKFNRIQVYDDDSFVNLPRMKQFFEKFIERGLHEKLKIDFRGIRVNEIDRMDDDYLNLMVKAGTEVLAIGVESGSDETLKRMKKNITSEQIKRVGAKLSRFPDLHPHFNIMCGTPGETFEDLRKTKEVMVALAEQNPSCFVGSAADWKPYPGSAMTEVAKTEFGLKLPETLEDWAEIDTYDAKRIQHPWYTPEYARYIKMLQIASLVIDGKIGYIEKSTREGLSILRFMLSCAKAYRPIMHWRLRNDFSAFLIESKLRDIGFKMLSNLA